MDQELAARMAAAYTAWGIVVAAFKDDEISPPKMMALIEECIILYGDPNAQSVTGTIIVRSKQ